MLTKRAMQRVDDLYSQGNRPEKLRTSEAIGLKSGGKRSIILVDSAGRPTAAGLYYQQKSGQDLPAGGFLQQAARREGNVETIQLRDGKRGITRRWDAGNGDWQFTALGKKYYATLRRNYIADVPVLIEGKRKNGSTYRIKSHMPVEKLGLRPVEVPLSLSLDERRALVKRMVLSGLRGKDVLYEVSNETWRYDPDGSWRINEETVGVDPDSGVPEAHVILDRRTRAVPMLAGSLLFQDAICPEAFVEADDCLCAPRQIAALLKVDLGEVCHQLSLVSQQLYGTESWEDQGATPRMILEFCRKNSYGCVVVHNEEVIETLSGSPILAFTVHEDHCWFYKDPFVRRALSKRTGAHTARLRKAQRQSQTPPATEWSEWQQEVLPGHFWTWEDQIAGVRAWMLERRISPKVLLKDETRIRTLIVQKGKEACYVHSLPETCGDLQKWLERLEVGIPYRGEGLPALSLKVLQCLVKRSRERVVLTGEQKAEILEEHGYSCAMCGSRGALEFDHIARLSCSFGAQEFQPLCVECHREKTANESRMYDDDQLASHFELEVWKQYVESPRPPPLVAKLRKCDSAAGLEIADVVRCRRSALLRNAHPLPVFCPLDDIKVRTLPQLGDVNFVTKPLPRGRAFASLMGYTGPGWQHRVQTEWLLHSGIITWEDVSHTLTATAHLPAGLLAEPLETMERAWDGDLVLAKLSVNSLIGLWAIDEATAIKVRSSSREDDAPRSGCLTSTFHYDGGFVYDFVTRSKLVTNASCRPLHDLCMCTEAVRVGQMLFCLKMADAIPCEIKTDSVLFRPKKRRRVELAELTFRDLDTLYTKAFPLASPPIQLQAICSEEHPFRQAPATERDLLKCDPDLPARSWDLTLKWRNWAHCDPEEGERRALAGGSLLVQGIAGTGKTTYCRGIIERLRAAGERVDIISKTHVASRRAGGVTADHWVRRHVINGSPKCTVLWIDEISQIDVGLLLQICKLTFADNIRFLLSGDFNQFAPIGNAFRGTPVAEDALEKSNLLHTMAGGNMVTLTTCRRSDSELFDFYASLIPGGSRFNVSSNVSTSGFNVSGNVSTSGFNVSSNVLPKHIVAEARRVFNFQGFCRSNLVISHRKRIQLNRQINEELAPACAVRLEIGGRPLRGNSAQTMLIWPGIELLGAVPTERRGIRNGCLYTVVEVCEDAVKLQELDATFTFEQVKNWLRLSYAQTYASVQGTEFTSQLRLHDTSHRFFTRRHLFVGLSRARAARDVSVVE